MTVIVEKSPGYFIFFIFINKLAMSGLPCRVLTFPGWDFMVGEVCVYITLTKYITITSLSSSLTYIIFSLTIC